MDFKTTREEALIIAAIAKRAAAITSSEHYTSAILEIAMDVTAVHANGCPLDLQRLSLFPRPDFIHDIMGIYAHLDRSTGLLRNCFVPRSAKKGA